MAASQVLLAGRAFATSKIVRTRSPSTGVQLQATGGKAGYPQNIWARRSRTNAGLKPDSRISGSDEGYVIYTPRIKSTRRLALITEKEDRQ